MTSTVFQPGTTITHQWLNDVNTTTYTTVPALSNSTGAGSIGYTEGGTGAVATTVQAKLREQVSVKDFGAVGDGITDDTAAIQAAISYCVTNKKDLYFPAATYAVTQIVFSNNTKDRMFTVDFAGSIIKGTTTTSPVSIVGTYWNIENLTINNAGAATYAISIGWLWQSNITNLTCDDVYITPYATAFGVYWNTFRQWSVGKIHLAADIYSINHNIWYGTRCNGIEIPGPVNTDFYNNVFDSFDILGTVSYGTNAQYQPLILRNCNFELNFNVTGNVHRHGGHNAPTGTAQFYDFAQNVIHKADASYSQLGYRYQNEQTSNLILGGDR